MLKFPSMSRSREIISDLEHYKAILFDQAWSRYEFSGRRGPIIGITGVGGGWHRPVRDYILGHDIGGTLAYFGFLGNGIDYYLPRLDDEIKKHPSSVILGFSGGGFIALRYAEKYGWDNVRKIITVATPFAGVSNLPSQLGETFRELTPGSKFLKEIVAIKPPEPNKVLSLLSFEDRYTPNPYNLKLNWSSAVLEGKSHGSLQSTWDKISNVLESELEIL